MSDYYLNKAYPRDTMAIIIGMGIQSGENAPDDSTPLPSSFEVDYIRHYAQTYDLTINPSILDFDLYPNPNLGEFTVDINEEDIGNYDLSILNYLGETIYKTQGINQSQFDINIENEIRGIYFLVLYTHKDNQYYSKKFFKK